jgi:hypothetical protein
VLHLCLSFVFAVKVRKITFSPRRCFG